MTPTGRPIRAGFPHSDIFGSKLAPNSPKLVAGCHVLHRLYAPRHPPNALITLEPPPCTGHSPPQLHSSPSLYAQPPANRAHADTHALAHAPAGGRSFRKDTRNPAKIPAEKPGRDQAGLQFLFNDVHEPTRSRPGYHAWNPGRNQPISINQSSPSVRGQWLVTNHQSPSAGGGERNRTDDLLLAKQALSRLSYTPGNRTARRRPRAGSNGGPG